jgi:hypothetical protein
MSVLVMAWLFGQGLVTYRTAKAGAPPTPGSLVAVSGFFALLALLATYKPAVPVAAAMAVGVDIAALLQVLPGTKVARQTKTWPPALITDPTVFMPGTAGVSSGAGNPAANNGPGGTAPGATPGAPQNPGLPPTGPGTSFPPGSQNLLWSRPRRLRARRLRCRLSGRCRLR